jgi:hypothetical protein
VTIGSDTVFTDDFTRSDNGTSLGADYTVQCSNGTATTYGIATNRGQLTSGSAGGQYSWAKINPALFGSANYRVRIGIQETGSGNNIGAMVRLSTSGSTPTGYFLGKNGAGAVIRRYDAGVITNLVDFQYIGAWDGATGLFHLQLDVDISGSDVVLTVASASSEGGTYTTRATYTDTSGSKILTAGTAAISTAGEYNGANLKTWDYFRVIGTAAGASAPSITDVDEDNTVTLTQANVEIDGADFDTATVDIEQADGPISCSIDSQDADTITFDMPADTGAGPHLKHGAATLTVTNDDDQADTQAITITPVAGTDYVDVGTPDAEADNRITAVADIETGDQLQWGNVQGTGMDETDVVVNDDGTFDCDEAVTAFDVRAWDVNDATWGDWATQGVEDDDGLVTVPDVVGDDQATGTSTLEGAGFVVAVQSAYSGSVAAGDIISQSPTAGSEAEEGSTVTIVVSIGAAPVFDGQTRDGRARGFLKPMYGRG